MLNHCMERLWKNRIFTNSPHSLNYKGFNKGLYTAFSFYVSLLSFTLEQFPSLCVFGDIDSFLESSLVILQTMSLPKFADAIFDTIQMIPYTFHCVFFIGFCSIVII